MCQSSSNIYDKGRFTVGGTWDLLGKKYVPLLLYAYWVTEAQSEGISIPSFKNRMGKGKFLMNEFFYLQKGCLLKVMCHYVKKHDGCNAKNFLQGY